MQDNMSEVRDDPREVLAMLNSLGFVGITAHQLKSFMKDLKMYRKLKDRERQQRKEELRKKILSKQQGSIKEILEECKRERQLCNTSSSVSSIDESLVKVRIRCVPQDELSQEQKIRDKKLRERTKPEQGAVKVSHVTQKAAGRIDIPELQIPLAKSQESLQSERPKDVKVIPRESKRVVVDHRPRSAPNLQEIQKSKSTSADSNVRNKTLSADARSDHKSFIRPWKLQPDTQKSLKSDPVALYQKYQREWKQISFPGEAKHSGIRWAVREKMLGGDVHPKPLPKKSASMPTLRR